LKESEVTEGAQVRRKPEWDSGRRPVHPTLVHVPVGGVVVTAVCDVVSAAGDGHSWSRGWFQAGSYAMIVGTVVLLAAVVAGFVERGRRTAPETPQRAAVNRHAMVMSLLGVVCVVDLILRNNVYSGAAHTPAAVLVLTLVALVLTGIGGELGGQLTYRAGIGVSGGRAAPGAVSGRPGDRLSQ
jgi:uncharacterized membrane protein